MSTSTSSARAATVAPDAATGTRRRGGIHGVTSACWIFVGPFVFGLIVFVYLPIIWSVVLSFSRAQNTVTSRPLAASPTAICSTYRSEPPDSGWPVSRHVVISTFTMTTARWPDDPRDA